MLDNEEEKPASESHPFCFLFFFLHEQLMYFHPCVRAAHYYLRTPRLI